MNNKQTMIRVALLLTLMIALMALFSRLQRADTGVCDGVTVMVPFTDVMGSPFFCEIAAAYFSDLAAGTSPNTFDPNLGVTREQAAAFITRTEDSALKRGSLRAALNQWATPPDIPLDVATTVENWPSSVQSDGADLWVANNWSGSVSRVRASDGRLLETWTGASAASRVLIARGRVFITSLSQPGRLYQIDPRQPAGAVQSLASNLGDLPSELTSDGLNIWTANRSGVSRINPVTGNVTTVTAGFSNPAGIIHDGAHIWVTDFAAGTLLKLNPDGSIAQTVGVGGNPMTPVFDGTNIWVPNTFNSIAVVRASTGTIVATLTGNASTTRSPQPSMENVFSL